MTDGSPVKRSTNLEEHKALLARIFENSPFVKNLGITVTGLGIDTAELKLPSAPHVQRNLNVLHGGAVATLIDTAGGVAAFSDFTKVETLNAATINLFVNYLAAAPPGVGVLAKAKVRKRGKSIVVIDVDVEDDSGLLVATGTVTYKLGSKVGAKKPGPDVKGA